MVLEVEVRELAAAPRPRSPDLRGRIASARGW